MQPSVALYVFGCFIGYEGIYQKRTGKHLDGCAMFYQTSHLQLLEHHIVQYQMNTGTCTI